MWLADRRGSAGTTVAAQPGRTGTAGRSSSRAEARWGPSFQLFSQDRHELPRRSPPWEAPGSTARSAGSSPPSTKRTPYRSVRPSSASTTRSSRWAPGRGVDRCRGEQGPEGDHSVPCVAGSGEVPFGQALFVVLRPHHEYPEQRAYGVPRVGQRVGHVRRASWIRRSRRCRSRTRGRIFRRFVQAPGARKRPTVILNNGPDAQNVVSGPWRTPLCQAFVGHPGDWLPGPPPPLRTPRNTASNRPKSPSVP